ncbi:hypothetical protein [Bosea sp. (in: a-proteobacteria)]|jgi:hypothetical protein|uniref:hypothetical protein n=1 Tax=Bosea sp. (in: a-proteobacteria) TaxID=1871050 RepID=UPI0027377C40|nr:hypothetical protein [Bosea sp. (in: a-proteobacteria)]MDP3408930.1 hypothetical protein [Bosea sp. (in: a-proteobacteria)]
MRFSRVELVFVAFGASLGALVAAVTGAGWIAPSASFPPFLLVLLGLGLSEILAGFALGRPPGALVRMPARMLAFGAGIGVLALLMGGLG